MTAFRSYGIGLVGVLALAAVGAAATASAQQPGLAINLWEEARPVADLSFIDADGRILSLDAFGGKTVLLNVWATWCAPCRQEMPALDRLQRALGGDRFQVVALSVDSGGPEDVRAFYEDVEVTELDILIDESGSAMRDLRLIGLPTTLLIDEQGNEIGRKEGPLAWDSADFVAFLRARMSANPVETVGPPG